MTEAEIMIAALKAAQEHLQEELESLLSCNCLIGDDGTPDRLTLDVQDEADFITPLENLIDQIKMAIEGKQQAEFLGEGA